MNQISHSGRVRSSGMATSWPARSVTLVQRAAVGGTAMWRRCQSRSKSGSSIQSGWWMPKRHLDEPAAERWREVEPRLVETGAPART